MPSVSSFLNDPFSMGDEERTIGRDGGQNHTNLRSNYKEIGLPHAIDLAIDLATPEDKEHSSSDRVSIAWRSPPGKPTDLWIIVVGTIQEVCREAVTPGNNVEGYDTPPIGNQRWYPVNQFPEVEQEAEFDGHDGTPGKRLIDGDPLQILIDWLKERWVQRYILEREADVHSNRKTSAQSLYLIQFVESDRVHDDYCADQAADSPQQESIIDREFFLHPHADVEAYSHT
ncbi:MAG: hypothetical protein L6R38_007848 [Xanthoria sp. 2 TBL-2021]|nr:MAG: hypothetical protein L6R38_007848 [Xanthoria sp. 2 TBL-2021]